MEPYPVASDLAASVQQTLRDEARLNELGLAAVRIVALAIAAILDLMFHLFPRQAVGLESVSAAHAALAFAWLSIAIGVSVALKRGWYTKASRIALTVLDPMIILTLFLLIYDEFRDTPKAAHPIVVTAVACALLATTGALRMSAFAAKLATLASVVTFAAVAFVANYTFVEALFVCGLIFAAGLLGMRLAQNTRRAVLAQANRVILSIPGPDDARRSRRNSCVVQSERQRRYDRHVIGASAWRLQTPWCEPATEHGSGIVGDTGERRKPHPV